MTVEDPCEVWLARSAELKAEAMCGEDAANGPDSQYASRPILERRPRHCLGRTDDGFERARDREGAVSHVEICACSRIRLL